MVTNDISTRVAGGEAPGAAVRPAGFTAIEEPAELAVLGAILIRNEAIDEIGDVLEPAHFRRQHHQHAFRAMRSLRADGQPIDPITIEARLRASGDIAHVDRAFLYTLGNDVPRSTNVQAYAAKVRAYARDRELLEATETVAALVRDGRRDRAVQLLRTVLDRTTEAETTAKAYLTTDVEIMQTPDVQELIAGMLFARTLAALVGPQGTGKTTVGMTIGYSVATGRPLFGREVRTSGNVIICALEGQPMLKGRIAAIKTAYGLRLDETSGVFPWLGTLDLLDPASVLRFLVEVKTVAPTLVVIDTFAMAFTGDENSSQDVGLALRALQRIRDELSCAVLVIHHTNAAATRERGSTAFRAGVDTLLMLTVADDAVRLVAEKQRDAAPFPEIEIKLTPVEGCQGQVAREAVDVLPSTVLTLNQMRALTRLREDFVDGASTTEWRATVPEIPERSFFRIVTTLYNRNYVTKEGQGRHVRYRPAGVTLP